MLSAHPGRVLELEFAGKDLIQDISLFEFAAVVCHGRHDRNTWEEE